MTLDNQLPPPEMVLQAAQEEHPQRILDDYTDAIHELRRKNFTFREIAEWLGKFGFEVDHNAVWRAYAKTVSESQAINEAHADEQLETEEAIEQAVLNGQAVTMASTPPNGAKTRERKKVSKAAPRKAKKP